MVVGEEGCEGWFGHRPEDRGRKRRVLKKKGAIGRQSRSYFIISRHGPSK